MELKDYTKLQDDGCPNCPEHVDFNARYAMIVMRGESMRRVGYILKLEPKEDQQ